MYVWLSALSLKAHTMKLKLLAIALLAVFTTSDSHADFKAKMLAKLAKAMAPAAPTTATLSDVSLTVLMESNLAPAELGTLAQSFIPGWKTGGDALVVMFSQKKGAGYMKIDGTDTVDGKPADYLTIGKYTVITEASSAARKVEVVTRTGEKQSFTVMPSKAKIKLVSINKKKGEVEVDLGKDMVLELEGTGVPANALVKVSIAVNQLGIKSMYEVCYVRYAPTITIPAAAFRNINIVPAAGMAYSYKKSFLAVGLESIEYATDVSGSISSVPYTSQHTDGMFIDVKKEPDEIADNNSFEQWELEGSLDAAMRANAIVKRVLAEYEPPPIDEAKDEELREWIDRKKASFPDSNV
jgi:hypothetical protein